MARFCIPVLIMLLSMCVFSSAAQSPIETYFWQGRKPSAAAVSFWKGEQISPAATTETPTPSAMSLSPADAPAPSCNGGVSNEVVLIGSLVALVAAVLVL